MNAFSWADERVTGFVGLGCAAFLGIMVLAPSLTRCVLLVGLAVAMFPEARVPARDFPGRAANVFNRVPAQRERCV